MENIIEDYIRKLVEATVKSVIAVEIAKVRLQNDIRKQYYTQKELGINYLFSYKVRTKTIAKLMGYSLKELMNMYPQIKNAQSVESQSAH